jgi:glutaredoxin
MNVRGLGALLLSAMVVSSASLASGCKRGAGGSEAADGGAAIGADLVVRDDSQGLLLTWIDEHGDFHVVESVGDVPLTGRDTVRVVDPNRETGEDFVITDLRAANPNGTYPVRTMKRADFEALAVARRQENGPTLGSAAPDQVAAKAAAADAGAGAVATGRPAAIIYGASWCGACHQAAAYLKQKKVPYVEKDIEADSGAAAEMQGKLAKIGQRGGSIPVLDIRGRVMVGFNPHQVDDALGQAL